MLYRPFVVIPTPLPASFNHSFLLRLLRLSKFRLWLYAVLLASILTESIVAAMDGLLHGKVSFDYLLTGLVASVSVAAVVSAAIIFLLGQWSSVNDANRQLNTIINALPVPLALVDGGGRVLMLNPEFSKTFGYSREDIPTLEAWNMRAYPDPDYRERVGAERQARRIDPKRCREAIELQIRCKDFSDKLVMASFRRLSPDYADLELLSLYDVSERAKAMKALAESQALLQSVIETIPLRVFWKDTESHYMGCNSLFAFDGGAGWVADVIGKVDRQLAWFDQAEQYRADDRLVMQTGSPKLAYEEVQTTPEGRHILRRTSKVPLRNSQGRTIGVLGVYDDITALKVIENELWLTKTMLDRSKTAIFWINRDGLVVYVNDHACQALGYSREELLTMRPSDFDPDFSADAWPAVWQTLLDHGIVNHESRHQSKDGRIFPVDLTCHYIEHNGLELSFTFAQNISERKLAEIELRIAATAFESQEGMVITDAATVILKVNKSFSEITGYRAEEVVGRKIKLLKSGIHDADFYAQMWDSIQREGSWQGEIWNRRKNGKVFPEWLTITAVKNADGAVTHYVVAMLDITARKTVEDHLHHLAHHDALTDLPNRTLLTDRLHQAMAQARRDCSLLALLYLDLDKFKPVNDSFGHDIGDLLLKDVAARLLSRVRRESDTVSRLGGDEFVVLLTQLEQPAAAALVAESILQGLNQPFAIQGQALDISCSVGIALYPRDGADTATLMKHADSAMYQAKCAGRDCFRFYAGDNRAEDAAVPGVL